jgi:hypothetical protein
VEAGFDATFESQNKLDVVGWDGNYGLTLTGGPRFACYAAADISSMQERGWRMDNTVVSASSYRANEFFRDSVSTLSLGRRIDV